MDEDRIVRMSLLLLAAILAAMTQARLLIHVHVYPPPAQGSENFKPREADNSHGLPCHAVGYSL